MITLNVNGLNAATKGHGLSEWTQKQDPYICCLQETHFRYRDTYRQEVERTKHPRSDYSPEPSFKLPYGPT